MSRKLQTITKEDLLALTVPVELTGTSYKDTIKYTLETIVSQGYEIESESYRSTSNGDIAQGLYIIKNINDQELSFSFSWVSSYNKQIKFQCAAGVYNSTNDTVLLTGKVRTNNKKRTGNTIIDMQNSILQQLNLLPSYYLELKSKTEAMKQVTLSSRKKAELLGILFVERNLLTSEQASAVKKLIDKPTCLYDGGVDSLWSFFNHVNITLMSSHPKTWIEDISMLNAFISEEFSLDLSVNQQASEKEPEEIKNPLISPCQAHAFDIDDEEETFTLY